MDDGGGFFLEGGGRAALLLNDYGAPPEHLMPLAEALAGAGFTVSAPALFGPGKDWTAWLREARAAFVRLRDAHPETALCGVGAGVSLALLLAGCCPAEQLVLSPMPPTRAARRERFALRALERRSLRALCCVTARTVLLLDENAGAAAARRVRRLGRLLDFCEILPFRDGLAPAILDALGATRDAAGPAK